MRALYIPKSNGLHDSCDARCHRSRSAVCKCICQGLLHGKGDNYAQANKRRAAVLLRCQPGMADLREYPPKGS